MNKDLLIDIAKELMIQDYTFTFEAYNILINGKNINNEKTTYVITRDEGYKVRVEDSLTYETINIFNEVEQVINFLKFVKAYKE